MKNAGYRIIHNEQYAPGQFIVLGHNIKNKVCPFVTWEWNQKRNSYFWGHYYENYNDALKDYHTRLAEMYKIPF